MRRITSFKPQHRQPAARSATPPPPTYEPLSPVLRPAAGHGGDALPPYLHPRSHDEVAAQRQHPNGAPAHAPAVLGDSRAVSHHCVPPATRELPPPRASALPPPHPLPHSAWTPGSPIEALADAAISSQRTSPAHAEHTRRASYAAPAHSPNALPHPLGDRAPKHAYPLDPASASAYPYEERPAKRARSEFYSASSPTYPQHHSRPATSHNPGWSYNVEHMADAGMRMYQDNGAVVPKQEHKPDKRLSDAQLLLDFFQVSAHTAQTPPSTAKRLSVSQIAPPYSAQYPPLPSPHQPHQHHLSPHAAAPQQHIHHAQHARPSSDVAHVPDPPSLPTDVTLPAPAVQTRTPPEDSSTTQPPPPMSNTANTEDTKPKKHQGWPKGKPRGPRSTPSSSKKKKATPKPKNATATNSKAAPDQPQSSLTNGIAASADASTSSSANITPPYDRPSGSHRRHSFSNSFLVLPTTDTPSAAVRAQSVPLQTVPSTAPPAAEPTRRPKAQQVAEPDLICASCKSSDSEVKVGDGEQWIGCDGCKEWYHYACAGFNSEREVRDVNKFYCEPCRPKFGQTTSRSTAAFLNNMSDQPQRFANLSELTPRSITPV